MSRRQLRKLMNKVILSVFIMLLEISAIWRTDRLRIKKQNIGSLATANGKGMT